MKIKNILKKAILGAALSFQIGSFKTFATQSIFTDSSAGACSDAGAANTGNGTCTISATTAFNETETITFTATTAGSGATFSVSGSVSGSLSTVTAGSTQTVYDSYGFPKFSVNLSNGGTPYVAGDDFSFTVTAGSELKKSNFDLFTLAQVCANGCAPGVVIQVPLGSKSAPSINGTTTSSNSGLYFAAADQPSISADGVDVARFRSDGQIDFGVGAEDDDHNTGTSGSDFNYRGQTFRTVSATTTGVTIAALNRSATSGADAVLKAETASSGGDPYTFWSVNGTGISMGVDVGDGSSLRIVDGTGLTGSTTTRARLDGSTKSWEFGTDTNTSMTHKFIGASVRIEEDASGGPAIQIRSLRTTVGSGESLGAMQWYSSDATTGGAGVQSDIRAIETGGTGVNYYMTFRTGTAGVLAEAMRLLDTGRALFNLGTTANPGVAAISDVDTGLQWGGSNDLYIVAGGVASLQVFSTYISPIVNIKMGTSGNAAAPDIAHNSDSNTGIVWGQADDIYFSAGGNLVFTATSTAITIGKTGTTIQHSLNTALGTNGAQVATMTNLPAAATSGNPAVWVKITVNGTTGYMPVWQ